MHAEFTRHRLHSRLVLRDVPPTLRSTRQQLFPLMARVLARARPLLLLPLLQLPGTAARSAVAVESTNGWNVVEKCNHTRALSQSASRRAKGYGAGWMPTNACGRDDLHRHDSCAMTAPPPRPIPSKLLDGAKLYSDRRVALAREVQRNGTLAEVGILYGTFTRWMVAILQPAAVFAIDLKHSIAMSYCFGRTRGRAIRDGNRTRVHCLGGHSSAILKTQLDDGALDLIYIDADHEYAGVCQDLESAYPKVRVGGLLVFNDYYKLEWFSLATSGRFGVYGVMCVARVARAPAWLAAARVGDPEARTCARLRVCRRARHAAYTGTPSTSFSCGRMAASPSLTTPSGRTTWEETSRCGVSAEVT